MRWRLLLISCAWWLVVLLDFFIRHGILTPENEPDFIEICSRIHRRFEFPTW